MVKRSTQRSDSGQGGGTGGGDGTGPAVPPGTTGRFLVLLRDDDSVRSFGKVAGLSVASPSDFENNAAPEDFGGAEALVLPSLGVAVVDSPPERMAALASDGGGDILAVEPERVVYALQERLMPQIGAPAPERVLSGYSRDYLEGYRDAVNNLCDRLIGGGPEVAVALAAFDEAEFTWGLQATRAAVSRFTGKGIRVAVLDTGFDPGHPDFAGRTVTMQSFVPGETAQDGHGHGTHCIGTACGSRRPGTLPGYGVASEVEIFAGKVLSNRGSGGDGGILAGIAWALENGCAIVSMSLGAPVEIGQPHSQVFERAARRALAAGTVIIAAAGNESERPQIISPVGHPANCPSIMAVGAVDRQFRIAPFSCAGLGPQGGQVDIAGPGVAIRSSWPRPVLYRTISGTSMATPHVAGIAALYAQSDAALRGRALISMLTQSARRMTLPASDVGTGLVQAP